MVFKTFDELIASQKGHPNIARMAVAAADAHTIEAALHARKEGIATPYWWAARL